MSEENEEVEQPKQQRVERKSRKKRTSPQIWKFFDISGSSSSRLRKDCPRCGSGVFLAEHSDRSTCGRCSYTQFKKTE